MPATIPYKYEKLQLQARAVIAKYQELTKTDDQKASLRIRRNKQSFQNKKKRPETFTLGELWEFCELVHMTGPDRAIILGAVDVKQIFGD